MLMQVSFSDLGGGFRQIDQSIRRSSLEEGGRIATVLKCLNINKRWLTGGNKSAVALISRRFAGAMVVSLEWMVPGKQWHTPVKGCFRSCALDLR